MKIYIGVTSNFTIIVTNSPIQFDGTYIKWISTNTNNISEQFNNLPYDVQEYIINNSNIDPTWVGSIGELEI